MKLGQVKITTWRSFDGGLSPKELTYKTKK
jgi:hypothetical protein